MGIRFKSCKKCQGLLTKQAKACPHCGHVVAEKKYKNVKQTTTVCGQARKFDSQGEAARAGVLEMKQKAGEIRDLGFQASIKLVPEAKITYRPDFVYTICSTGERVHEDFKSYATRKDAIFVLKIRLWQWRGPTRLLLSMLVRSKYSFEWIAKGTDPLPLGKMKRN